MTKQYFFTSSIGPVQGFVATARTSQDLWFGSWLLSELAKAAAKALRDGGHTLIFPAPDSDFDPGSALDAGNKVVAILSGNPEPVASQVGDAIANRLEQLAKSSFDAAEAKCKFNRDFAVEQLKDLIEFYWAAVLYDPSKGDDDYKRARARAEALFNARKNTRSFQQAHGKDGLPKSSLDGFRESVLLDDGDIEDSFENLRIEKGEKLSGVDLLKRWGKRQGDVSFVSTTDIAVRPFAMGVGVSTFEALLAELKALRRKHRGRKETDGTHFYQERMVQLLADKSRAADFRKEFAGIFEKYGIKQRPSPYYAVLQADGDNMGKTIDNQNNQQRHSDLSKALSLFATQAKKIIKEQGGVPIYVGGDDILAYLPQHTVLACVKMLDAEFSKALKDFVSVDGISPTLSVGLAIAHHLTPLSQVLQQVRDAEKTAKRVQGKNGLAISLSKRGSAEHLVRDKLTDLVGRMEQLIDMTLQKAISHGTAYELEDLKRRLNIPDIEPTRKAMLQKEAIRIITRKRESGSDEKLNKQTRENFETWLLRETLTLDELAGEMIIAAELANSYAIARISPKEAAV